MSMLRNRRSLIGALCAATAFMALPGVASAQLLSCEDILNSPPLVDNPAIFSATSTQATTGGRAYCNVSIVYRDPALVGAAAGYAPGNGPPTIDSYQHIRMGMGFPLNTNTADAAWSGRIVQTSAGGFQGSVASFTAYISSTNPATGVGGTAGQAGIGVSTDSGHGTADSSSGSSEPWGYVPGVGPNYGKIKDWAGGRSYCTSIVLAKQIARTYYGAGVYDATAKRTYWEGNSGGGQMGLTQAQNCPEEYNGLALGHPSNHIQQFRLQDSWQAVVMKKAAALGVPFTSGQVTSAHAAGVAYCMTRGAGGVVVGTTNTLIDPRSCDWKATMHVCGQPTAPAAPNCLLAGSRQAELLQQVIDGPKNAYGKLVFYPYSFGVNFSSGTNMAGATTQVMSWNHLSLVAPNNVLFADAEHIALAGSPPGATTFVDEMALGTSLFSDYSDSNATHLDRAKNAGLKIIQYHGTHDALIMFRKDPAFYREVATYFGGGVTDYAGLQSWYRFYLEPGNGHNRSPYLPDVMAWVENGVAPDRLIRTTAGVPLSCPYPQYPQYTGPEGGSTSEPSNYSCGGNLDANTNTLCSMVKTTYKGEKGPITNNLELGIDPRQCQSRR